MKHWLFTFGPYAIGCIALLSIGCNCPSSIAQTDYQAQDSKGETVVALRQGREATVPATSPRDTIIDEGVSYRVVQSKEGFIFILSGGDTVFKWTEPTNGFEVVDFDRDGNQDVLIHYVTNVPGIHDLLLYKSDQHQFVAVKDFESFPGPEGLAGTPYYYSYHRAGCADANWESDLFAITADSTVRYGNIEGHGCDSDSAQWIAISRVVVTPSDDSLIPLDTLPISVIEGYEDWKWGFIRDYWTKNYSRFLPQR